MLEVGSQAPDFTLLNQNGEEISLSQFKGKKVILYFYSKDNTPGCTKQACNYAQNYPAIEENGALVIGISKDSVSAHSKFAQKYQLPFIILSDPETKVLQAYDVWKLKKLYGREFIGVVRTTYLIDEEGKEYSDLSVVVTNNEGNAILYIEGNDINKGKYLRIMPYKTKDGNFAEYEIK